MRTRKTIAVVEDGVCVALVKLPSFTALWLVVAWGAL